MGEPMDMSPALEKLLVRSRETAADFHVSVVFTTVQATIAALKTAGALASRLGARITLLVPQIVPFPLPLNSPPVLRDFNERRFRVIADRSPVETTVRVYLCRDPLQALMAALKPHSVVVLGGRESRWPTAPTRLAKTLRRAGHEVIFSGQSALRIRAGRDLLERGEPEAHRS